MSRNVRTSLLINEVLKYLTVAGMAGSIVVAPNLTQVGGSILKSLDKRGCKLEARRVMQYMKKKQLVEYTEMSDGNLRVELTEKGKKRVQDMNFEEMKINKLRKWDKKWRLVMFDIPESRRRARRALSLKLKAMGFYQLQKSVWVHAYPCNAEVEVIMQVFNIPGRDVILAEMGSIDNQRLLLTHFELHA